MAVSTVPRVETNPDESFEINVKRFYMPSTTVHATCMRCGGECVLDLDSNYLSYPVTNEPFDVTVVCYDCDESVKVGVVLLVKLELAPETALPRCASCSSPGPDAPCTCPP